MSSDSVDRVEFMFNEIRESERTEVELWDLVERLAMEVLMLRWEETMGTRDVENTEWPHDWSWDAADELH